MRIEHLSTRRRVRRLSNAALWIGLGLVMLAGVAWAFPGSVAWGTGGVGLGHGSIVYVSCNTGDLQADWPAWVVLNGSRIVLAPTSRWRPSTMSGFVKVSSAGPGNVVATVTANLRSTWIPLWLIGGVLIPLAGLGRHVTRGHAAGCCEACGYDLRGLGGTDSCPECGRVKHDTASTTG